MNILSKLTLPSALALAGAAALTSCSLKSDYESPIELMPVQIEENGAWSFYSADGKISCREEFKNEPTAVVNGFFSVKEGEGYTLYKYGEKPEAVGDIEGAKQIGAMADGVVPVVLKNERISLVDGKGKKVATLEPYKGKEIISSNVMFAEGLLVVANQDEKQGYADTKGNIAIAPEFEAAYDFHQDLALVRYKDKNDSTSTESHYKVIDKKGNTVFKLKNGFQPTFFRFNFDRLLVKDNNDHFQFLDKKGEATKLSTKIKDVTAYNEKFVVYENDGGDVGIMTIEGEVIVRPKYNRIEILGPSKFLARKDKYCAIINAKGDEELKIDDFPDLFSAWQFGLVAKEKSSYIFLNDEGKQRGKDSEFSDVGISFSHSWIIRSDYFNTQGLADEIAKLITDNGVGKYKFGAGPSNYFSNPKNYTYTREVAAPDIDVKGYRYNISADIQFSGTMADYTWEYNYYTYSGDWRYYWNSVVIDAFQLNISTEIDFGISHSQELVKVLSAKGFKVADQTKVNKDSEAYVAILNKGKTTLCLYAGKDSSSFRLLGVPNSKTEYIDVFKQWVSESSNPSNSSNEVVEAVCDTVVACDSAEVVW